MCSNMVSPTALAWNAIGTELDLARRLEVPGSYVEVTAQQIKKLSKREPRLMTKFDTRESRPGLLRGVTILPLSNGTYALIKGDGYVDVPSTHRLRRWPISARARKWLTLPWDDGPLSESQALDMALATGLLQDFIEEDARLTIRGRLRSPRFQFLFSSEGRDVDLTADSVQIEVDAGLEGDSIHLIEAKLGARSNFHNRQLYYPYRMWESLIPHKRICAIFLSYSNRCFSLRRYEAPSSLAGSPLLRYHGLVVTKAVDYHFDELEPAPTLESVLANTELDPALAPSPFPQADDIRRVIDVVDSVAAGLSLRGDIASRYDLDDRQADYYANAASYLGLLVRRDNGFALSEAGAVYVRLGRGARIASLLHEIARRPVFRQVLEATVLTGKLPSRDVVASLIVEHLPLRGKTPNRRAGTVLAWCRWVLANTSTQLSMPFD